jgi:hypothetical protein
LLAAVISVVGGYLAGVRTSRNERRNDALAEIFKEMALFYRYLVSWTDTANPDPAQPTAEAVAESSDIPARKHVNDQYRKFVLAFYGNAIWLDKTTYDLIQEFSLASRDLLNELNSMRGGPVPGVYQTVRTRRTGGKSRLPPSTTRSRMCCEPR